MARQRKCVVQRMVRRMIEARLSRRVPHVVICPVRRPRDGHRPSPRFSRRSTGILSLLKPSQWRLDSGNGQCEAIDWRHEWAFQAEVFGDDRMRQSRRRTG